MFVSVIVAWAILLSSFPALAAPPVTADSAALKRDSTHRNPFDRDAVGSEPAFTPYQDTTYLRGKRIHVTAGSRFRHDITHTDSAWREEQYRRANTIEGLLAHNLTITPLDMIPSERQRMDHDRQLHPGAPSDIMPVFPRVGISVDFDTRTLLGLEEDVSPSLTYNVPRPAHVSIMIYNAKGDFIVQLFEGSKARGKQTITWNELDKNGNDVPAGDYVFEVIVDNDRRITKRVLVK